MLQSALCRPSRLCHIAGAYRVIVRELMRVGARRGHRTRLAYWVIASVLSVTMVAFTGTAAAQTPRLNVLNENALEGDDIVFKVLLSSSSNQSVTVQYTTANGADRLNLNVNAQSGSDFTAASGTLTFAPGETRKTVRVSTTEDRAYEWNEIFYLRLSNPTNARLFGSTATGTIDNDDSPPTVSISDGSATEGDEVQFKVSLSAPTGRSVYVDLKPEVGTGDTAKPLDDFDDRGLEFAMAGGTDQEPISFTARVATVDDDVDEPNETFTVRLSNPRGLTLGDATATGTIVDDDDGTPPPASELPTVGFWLDPHVAEGGWMRFWVTLSKSSDRKVSVQYKTSSGTAQSGKDFTPASGLLVFPPGDRMEVVYVETERGGGAEGNETFTMTLSSPIHATLGDSTATATITEADTDVDGSPYVEVAESTDAVEGKPVTFTVRLSVPTSQTATVQYETRKRSVATIRFSGEEAGRCDSTAKGGVDYVVTSGTLTFAPQETEKTVSVSTIDDNEHECSENLYLDLSNPKNAAIRTVRSGKDGRNEEAEILDNDDAPVASFALQASSAQEDSGTQNVTVNLSPAPTWAIMLKFSDGGTASPGSDYGLLSGKVLVPAGATTATIPVEIIDDSVDDSGETIVLTLTAGKGYTVGTSHKHTLTIQNHEPAVPTVTVARKTGTASSVTEGTSAAFTVSASPAPSAPLTVDLTVEQSGDHAAAGETGSRKVVVPTGGSATVEVATEQDSADEPDGSVSVAVDAGTGYTVAAAPGDTASVAVTDDDATAVVLTVPDTTAAEGDAADMAQITLTLGRGLADGETLVAPLQFAGGTAGTLFTLTCPSPLPAGVTCQTLDSAPQVTFAGPSSGVSATAVTLSLAAQEDAGAANETVTVSIPASSSGNAPTLTATGLGGGATGSRTGNGQISITDNDVPSPTNPVSLSVSGNGAVDEGDPDPLKVTATLGTANATGSALAIPVQVRTAGTTAATADYTLAGTISVADGATSGEAAFTIADDGDVEDVETVVVELGSPLPSGVVAGTTDHVTIEVGDNDSPPNACLAGTVLADVQGYAKETGNGDAHVTRWKQALAAFGASNGETAMTAEEAQQHADDFWAVRWNPVVTAIECLENAANADPEIAVSGGNGIAEGDDAVFTVAASPAPTADLDVTLDVADDAAGDFLDTNDEGSHTVTIPAGQASATLTLSTTGDTTDEAYGSVTATVEAGTGYTVAAAPDDAASVAVTDDDATTVTLTTPDTTAAEDDAADTAQIALALGRGLVDGESLAVPLQFAGGTAGTLFTLSCPNPLPTGVTCQTLDSAPQVTFTGPASGASATEVTLSFAARDDTDSDNETVTVSIPASSSGNAPILTAAGLGGGATGARTGNGEIAIADDDPATCATASLRPTIEGYIAEQADGTPHVTRWKQVLAAFGDQNGYTPMTASQAQKNADDFLAARWNPVVTVLTCMENAKSADPEITVTGGSAVTEGGDVVFTVSADPAPTSNLTVKLTVADDATSDFLSAGNQGTQTVTIQANQPSVTLTLATENDNTDEPDGSVTATVASGTGYTAGSPDTASVAVSDDDAAAVPTLSVGISPASANEGDAGRAWATVTLGLDPVRAQPTTFKACLASTGTATRGAGEDYRFVHLGNDTPLTLTGECHSHTLAAHTASGEVRLMIRGDTAFEPDETVVVELRDPPQGVAVSGTRGSATYTIVNDDAAPPSPVLRLSAGPDVDEGGNAGFTVHADPAPQSDLTVAFTVAQSGDWLAAPGAGSRQVTLAAGATSVSQVVATLDDGTDEPDGSVSVTLQAGTGYTVAAPPDDATSVAVRDNDEPEVSISAGSGVTEGSPASFTVTANPAPHADLTVKLTIAQSGDHAASGQTGTREVVVPTGGSMTFEVATVNDSADEPDGAVTATLAAGTGYAVAASPHDTASVAVADDDAAGVPSFSVDDAEAHENEWWLRYTIRLSPASDSKVSVWVHTRESSPVSARDGEDYQGMGWGTRLVFPAGTTERKLSIRLVNDSHDEGPETFEVELLAPQGGAKIADGVGVMTIVNDDPMPAAFLARFGRTVAEQALDGIAGRIAAPRTAGVQGTLAGQALAFGPGSQLGAGGSDGVAANDHGPLALSDVARRFGAPADRFGTNGYGHDAFGFGRGFPQSRTMTGLEALLGSSFTATGETDGMGGSLAFWSRAAHSSFDGREGTFSLDGEATTAMLGADYARGDWLAGLALMQSSGEGGYADSGTEGVRCLQPLDAETQEVLCGGAVREGDGDVEASLTAAVPYAALQASERLKLWGAAGVGTGEVTLEPETGGSLGSDITWTMAAAGARSDLLASPREGSGPALALTMDALWTRTSSEKTHELAASESDVTRLRLGLEGSYGIATEGGGSLTPKVEVGARHDGGDAETGFGVEFGGGLAWTDPALGLSLDFSGRTLIAHGDDDLEDRGFAASMVFDPNPSSERGLSLTLRQDWGGSAQGGLDALFATDPLADSAGEAEAESRWQAEAAYGLPVFSGRFTGSPHVGLSLGTSTRDYTLGWRLTPEARANAPEVSFGVKATRRESEGALPEHAVGVELGARW